MQRVTVLCLLPALVACAQRPPTRPSPLTCPSLAGLLPDPRDTTVYDTLRVTIKPHLLSPALLPYPRAALRARLNGEATVAFIVDATGRVEPPSLYPLFLSNDVFAPMTRDLLLKSTFCPAAIGGRPVRARTEMAFHYAVIVDPYGGIIRIEIRLGG